MKLQADHHRSEKSFQIGDMVLLKLQPYKHTTVASMRTPKLSLKLYGPFKVLDTIGKVAYKLDLPAKAQIHNVFYVSKHLVIPVSSILYLLVLIQLRSLCP